MPRTLQRREPTTISASVLKDAKSEFLRVQPLIDEMKQKMKEIKKQQKEASAIINQYMDEEEVDELEVGTFTFSKQEVERCKFNEKNFSEFVENDEKGQELLEAFKEQHTETSTSYKVKKPRRTQNNDDDD